ncbi:MAG: hypothetical protein QF567_03115 [Candidatus Pacearchaeota archaeon]|nr:hypothetical protein [Candidatus Pacearchaeota archaeon]
MEIQVLDILQTLIQKNLLKIIGINVLKYLGKVGVLIKNMQDLMGRKALMIFK